MGGSGVHLDEEGKMLAIVEVLILLLMEGLLARHPFVYYQA